MSQRQTQATPKTFSDRAIKTGPTTLPLDSKRIEYGELDLTSLDGSQHRTRRINTGDCSDDQDLYILMNKVADQVNSEKTEGRDIEEKDIQEFLNEKFIGEFESNYNFKVIRAYINQESLDRIFYTKMQPMDTKPVANVLLVHGYGHSGSLLEVS